MICLYLTVTILAGKTALEPGSESKLPESFKLQETTLLRTKLPVGINRKNCGISGCDKVQAAIKTI